ncbi:hypothetical protein R83H12_00202 [Fibrobacteria bacterium R8-3-H12]
MDTEIPAELLLPTVEELEERTAKDLAIKWKLRKRPGKKERNAIKQEQYSAKLKAIAGEFKKQEQQTLAPASNKFSLKAINGSNSANVILRPTLRTALNGTKPIVTETQPLRKKGRPPKLRPI